MDSQLIPHGSLMGSWILFGFRVACVWMLFLMSHALPMGSSGCHSDFLRMPYGFLWVPVGFACMHILMYACELIWMRYGLPLDSLWTPPWVPIDPMHNGSPRDLLWIQCPYRFPMDPLWLLH